MGILDDAIREHLELKRQHGAQDEDLERLEKEAFGAPARPGDPEFGEDAEAPAAEAAAPAAAPEPGSTSDWLAGEEETTVAPQAPSTPAEDARQEHAHLDDTADHPAPPPEAAAAVEPTPAPAAEPEAPAPEPVAEAEAPAPATEPLPPPEAPEGDAAEAPPEAPERAIFDADEFDFDDVDLDLEEEDDGTVGPQPASREPESGAAPRFVEDDTDNPPLPVERPAQRGEEKASPESEDLLEETPDFLQDAPEGEDLWFEQGPPKDFDFDDD